MKDAWVHNYRLDDLVKYDFRSHFIEKLFWVFFCGRHLDERPELRKEFLDFMTAQGKHFSKDSSLLSEVQSQIQLQYNVPFEVIHFVRSAVLILQKDSHYSRTLSLGDTRKENYWKSFLHDSFSLMAQIPTLISFYVENNPENAYKFKSPSFISDHPYRESMIRYLFHEGGSTPGHTASLVSSTLVNPYLSFSATLSAIDLTKLPDNDPRFAIYLALATLAGAFWKRALMIPIEHPLSVSLQHASKLRSF